MYKFKGNVIKIGFLLFITKRDLKINVLYIPLSMLRNLFVMLSNMC